MKNSGLFNILFLVILVSLFLFTPFSEFKRMYIIGVLMFLWLASSVFYNRKSMMDTIPLIVILFLMMIIQYIYSTFPGNDDEFRRFFTRFLLTYVWGILGVFYASNIDLFKKGIPFFVLMIVVSSVYTIVGNLAVPNASRLLAGTEQEGSAMYELIRSMNIGGYDFIYALVFALFPSVLWFKYRLSFRVLSLVFIVIILGTLVVGSYFTSIILATAAIFLSLSGTRNKLTFLVVFCILSFVVLIFKDILLQGLIDFGEAIDSHMLQTRAQELLDGTYQEDADAVGQYSRADRLLNAFHNISQSPVFGRMTARNLDYRPSGHSELLGYFERYGLLGWLYLFFYFSFYKIIHKRAETVEMKRSLSVFFIFFLVFLFLNTFDVANATGCVVFFIAPCTMLYIEKRLKVDAVIHI